MRSARKQASIILALAAAATMAVGTVVVLAHERGSNESGKTGMSDTGDMSGMKGMKGTHSASGQPEGEMPGHSHERCELHGGQVDMTKEHHFETVFAPDGIRVYMYSEKQEPLPIDGPVGTVTLKTKAGATQQIKMVADSSKEGVKDVWFCTMRDSPPQFAPGKCPNCGMTLVRQTGLFAPVDLSKAQPGTLKATVHLTRLGGKEPEVTFTATNEPEEHELGKPAGAAKS